MSFLSTIEVLSATICQYFSSRPWTAFLTIFRFLFSGNCVNFVLATTAFLPRKDCFPVGFLILETFLPLAPLFWDLYSSSMSIFIPHIGNLQSCYPSNIARTNILLSYPTTAKLSIFAILSLYHLASNIGFPLRQLRLFLCR
jgi:hypothetical protein